MKYMLQIALGLVLTVYTLPFSILAALKALYLWDIKLFNKSSALLIDAIYELVD